MKASRPKLDLVMQLLRGGDTLKVTRLDRLSRSVLHPVTLGADLRQHGIGLHVTEQGIDTSTMEGRAMCGMPSVLAELQRGLIVATNTNDGLASAQARGRVGGRRPRLTEDLAALAHPLYDERKKTLQQIADSLARCPVDGVRPLDKSKTVRRQPKGRRTVLKVTGGDAEGDRTAEEAATPYEEFGGPGRGLYRARRGPEPARRLRPLTWRRAGRRSAGFREGGGGGLGVRRGARQAFSREHRPSLAAARRMRCPSAKRAILPKPMFSAAGISYCMKSCPRTGLKMRSLRLKRDGVRVSVLVGAAPGLWKLDSGPGIDFALSIGIVPCAHDCAVAAQAEGVRGAGRYGDDVAPITDFALSVTVVSRCKDPAGRSDPDGVVAARAERHHVFPPMDLARPGCPVSGRYDPPVGSEADGMEVPGRNGGQVTPPFHGTLPSPVVPRGQCGTVRPYADRVPVTTREDDHLAPGLHVALSF
ncbi:Resolvase domain-containing protein [Actinobacteria bacterium OV450]|nr:Resolvase domain-containing protein [Actinobacteria bacterium OV450]